MPHNERIVHGFSIIPQSKVFDVSEDSPPTVRIRSLGRGGHYEFFTPAEARALAAAINAAADDAEKGV